MLTKLWTCFMAALSKLPTEVALYLGLKVSRGALIQYESMTNNFIKYNNIFFIDGQASVASK